MTADTPTSKPPGRQYTPSMERLRDEYVQMRADHYGFADYYAEEFDRALAAHEAKVKAEALESAGNLLGLTSGSGVMYQLYDIAKVIRSKVGIPEAGEQP